MRKRRRIIVSVFFAVVAVVLSVTWGRSYYYRDQTTRSFDSRMIGVESVEGQIRISQVTPLPEVLSIVVF